jgi:hypothetical protein
MLHRNVKCYSIRYKSSSLVLVPNKPLYSILKILMVITLQILVDESSDAHQIRQPDLCICYVNKKGRVAERFLGIVLVQDTTYLTLTTITGDTLY